MDPALKGLLGECKGDQGVLRGIKTWPKADGVCPLYLGLSDEQKVERGACVLHQRVASRKEIDAALQGVVDMRDLQAKATKEDRDRSNGTYKGLYEQAFFLSRQSLPARAGMHDGMPSSRTGRAPWRSRAYSCGTRRRPLEALRRSGLH
jgi:hypothetical protein